MWGSKKKKEKKKANDPEFDLRDQVDYGAIHWFNDNKKNSKSATAKGPAPFCTYFIWDF